MGLSLTNTTCLVTGGDGFLAAHLLLALHREGARTVALCLNRKGQSSLSALFAERATYRIEYGDVTDFATMQRLVNSYEVDYVFHLAAVSAVRVASACPYRAIQTSVMGTLNVLEACRQSGRAVRGIVVASSDKAYGETAPPYYEGLPLLPTATYEASKAAAEMVCRAYRYEHGLPVAVTRCANLYGPGDLNWTRLVPGSVRRALRGESPVVYQESAAAQREVLHVSDAVRAYLLLAEVARDTEHCEHNVGSGERVSVYDLARQIGKLAGGPEPLLVPRPGQFREIPAQLLVSARMTELGWLPQTTLAEGLWATVGWYRQHLQGLTVLPQVVKGG